MIDPATFTVTQSELGQLLGLSPRQLRNLKVEIPPNGREGTTVVYHLRDSLKAFIDYRLSVRPTISEKDILDAKARRIVAEANKEEALAESARLDVALKKRQVVPISDARSAQSAAYAHVKAQMLAIPPAWAPRLAAQRSPAKVQTMLEEAIQGALGRSAKLPDDRPEAACDAST